MPGLVFFAAASPLIENAATCLGYIGPGLGLGALAAVLAFFLSLFLAIFAVVWYPIKRLFSKKLDARVVEQETDD
jgi:hypothetical protein